jgi:coniferyl-aldehyde dehydrogenase
MTTTNETATTNDADTALRATLALQRAAFLRDGPPTLKQRRADLKKLKDAILARHDAFLAALDADFGHRARQESQMLDLGSTVGGINYLHGKLRRFMREERRHVAAIFRPATAKVVYQPLGVVGIVAPWNFPVSLSLTPLATALAAGNRVMLKPSEMTPATTELLASMLAEIFDESQVAVVKGDVEAGKAFSSLPFDHLFFTGSIPVGRAIMRAASENLVPVTLELGGKSPVIVDDDYPLSTAARRIAYGKCANGGQICTSPDYLLLPKSKAEAFVAAYRQEIETLYPNIGDNPDFTWVVNDRHFARLSGLVEDAKAKGASIVELGAKQPNDTQSRLFPPTRETSCHTQPPRAQLGFQNQLLS